MSANRWTKDEKFIVTLYELTKAQEEDEAVFDCFEIGKKNAMAHKQVETITKQLVRGNIIKRTEYNLVKITPLGISIAESLLEK